MTRTWTNALNSLGQKDFAKNTVPHTTTIIFQIYTLKENCLSIFPIILNHFQTRKHQMATLTIR